MDENNNLEGLNNEMNVMPEEPNGNSGSNKGPIIALISVILVIVVLVGTAAFGIMGASSKTEKFLKMFVDDYMFEVFEGMQDFVFEEGKIVSDIAINPALITSVVGETEVPINRFALVSELTAKDMDFSGKVYLDVDSTELVTMKYAKTADAIGFTVPDLMTENIVVKNENLKELARKLGMTEEEIEQVPDKLSLDEMMKLTKQDEDEIKKLEEIFEKYKKPLENVVEGLLTEEKDQEITINDTAILTTKHSLPLTEKDGYELAKAFMNVAKDDEDLYNAVKEEEGESFEYETFEDWNADIETSLTEIEELIASGDDTITILEVSAYVKGNDTMAIELDIPSDDMAIRLATLNEKDFYHTEIVIIVESEEVKIIFDTITEENSYDGTLSVAMAMEGVDMNMNILDYTIKYSKEAEIEKLDLTKDFILNDKTEEEIDAKFTEIQNNIMNYATIIMEKAPESLKALMASDSSYEDDYYYDEDYDMNYDSEYNYDYAE